MLRVAADEIDGNSRELRSSSRDDQPPHRDVDTDGAYSLLCDHAGQVTGTGADIEPWPGCVACLTGPVDRAIRATARPPSSRGGRSVSACSTGVPGVIDQYVRTIASSDAPRDRSSSRRAFSRSSSSAIHGSGRSRKSGDPKDDGIARVTTVAAERVRLPGELAMTSRAHAGLTTHVRAVMDATVTAVAPRRVSSTAPEATCPRQPRRTPASSRQALARRTGDAAPSHTAPRSRC